MEELVGKTITALYVSEGEEVLKVDTTEGTLYYFTEGDCCSETWWADVIFSSWKMFPCKIDAVHEIKISDIMNRLISADNRTRQDFDEVYGYTLECSNGEIGIIYRNSSNGYYGGCCYLADMTKSYAKEKIEDVFNWTPVKTDWRA